MYVNYNFLKVILATCSIIFKLHKDSMFFLTYYNSKFYLIQDVYLHIRMERGRYCANVYIDSAILSKLKYKYVLVRPKLVKTP